VADETLPLPESDPYGNDDWCTVRAVVEYRFRAPADWDLRNLMLDRTLTLPPMRYSTGCPSLDGGPGTWRTWPVPPLEFMTYRHVIEREAVNWVELDVLGDITLEVLDDIGALLDASRQASHDGRAAIDRAIALRKRAFEILPVGAVLAWAINIPTTVGDRYQKTDSGWYRAAGRGRRGGTPSGPVRADWVEEQWMNGNLKVVSEAEPPAGGEEQ
jgi:hypothetical protein